MELTVLTVMEVVTALMGILQELTLAQTLFTEVLEVVTVLTGILQELTPAIVDRIIEAQEEEEVEGTGTILDVLMRQAPCGNTMSALIISTTISCSMTRWPCQMSTASPAETEEIDGGRRRAAI